MDSEQSGGLDAVDHVSVIVADLKRALEWYKTSFQCEVLYEDRTQAVLQFRNVKVALALPSQQQPHVAYLRADAAVFGELKAQADGLRSTLVSDPTGNIVEIVEQAS